VTATVPASPKIVSTTFDILAPVDEAASSRFQVLRWLRSIGDSVKKDEPLVEIETDKVTIEVAAPVTGILGQILKTEHDEVSPGEVLGHLESVTQSATLDGECARNAEVDAPYHHREWAGVSLGLTTPGATSVSTAIEPPSLSPAVLRLIKERNLDVAMIRGTGERGRITIDDVLSHQPMPPSPESARDGTEENVSERATSSSAPATMRLVPHTAMRKRIATHMVHSLLHTAPHVTAVFEADLANVETHQANHLVDFGQRGAPLTHTAYFVAAAVKAIRAVPESNSRWTEHALEIYEPIHIGIATNLRGTGVVVPVLRDVESLDLFGIAKGLYYLARSAQQGKLQREDVRGGTFTISNYGGDGCLFAAPIVINQPQSAILGVGAPETRPVFIEQGGQERVVARRKCYVSLTIDHRVMDGYRASRFLETFVGTLREWPLKS